MTNPGLKWLLQPLQQKLSLEPGSLEHLRSRLRNGQAGPWESHWFLFEGSSSRQFQELESLMLEFQQHLLQVEKGETWSLDAWNQGLLVPVYQVTLKTCFSSPSALMPLNMAIAEEASPVCGVQGWGCTVCKVWH